MPKIEPFEDRVLLKKAEEEKMSKGGLYIPDTAEREPSQQATIIAVGPGRTMEDGTVTKMFVNVGDVVWVGKYSGAEVEMDGEVFYMMRQIDILGRVVPG